MRRFGAILALLLTLPARAFAAELSLEEFLARVQASSPRVQAAKEGELASQAQIGVSQANYYPSIALEAIDSTGFPGSSGLTGVGGLMGSPFRSGAAYGAVLQQTIWDFGRTSSSVARAKYQKDAAKIEIETAGYRVKLLGVQAYFDCSRSRSQYSAWEEVRKESEVIEQEVAQFVKTGQKSLVEKYLVQAQTEEALTAEAGYSERHKEAQRRLSILSVAPSNESIDCPLLPASPLSVQEPRTDLGSNPLWKGALAQVQVASAVLDQAKAENLPKIVGVASVGDVEKARLVEKQDYSVAAGVIFPLFEGFRTKREIERGQALLRQREAEVDAIKQELSDAEARLLEGIRSSSARLEHLHHETALAESALALAKRRYFRSEGTLVDLREALRNITRTRTQVIDVTAEFDELSASLRLLNGGL